MSKTTTPSVIIRCGAPNGAGRRCNRIVGRVSTLSVATDGGLIIQCPKHDRPQGAPLRGVTTLRTLDVQQLNRYIHRAAANASDIALYAR